MGYIVQKAGSYVSQRNFGKKKIKFEHRTNMTDLVIRRSQTAIIMLAYCSLKIQNSWGETTVDELAGVNSEIQAIDDKAEGALRQVDWWKG